MPTCLTLINDLDNGYYDENFAASQLQRLFNTTPGALGALDTLPLSQWQSPGCCAPFKSELILQSINNNGMKFFC